jgi:hypothetical protein
MLELCRNQQRPRNPLKPRFRAFDSPIRPGHVAAPRLGVSALICAICAKTTARGGTWLTAPSPCDDETEVGRGGRVNTRRGDSHPTRDVGASILYAATRMRRDSEVQSLLLARAGVRGGLGAGAAAIESDCAMWLLFCMPRGRCGVTAHLRT